MNTVEKQKKEMTAKVIAARRNYTTFTNEIFSQSKDILKGGVWTGGKYVDEITEWYQRNLKTIRVSARDHMKSVNFYSYIMWLMFRHHHKNVECQYFSYNGKMAAYHTAKIKAAVTCNPFFRGIIDKKTYSESVIDFSWDGVHRFTVTPRGLLEFKRGIHSPIIFVDDPMQDPDNKLILTKINKINEIMRTQILDMAQEQLHIVGTPQTNADFFFDPEFTHRFAVKILPAIVNAERKEVLWEEWMDWDELMAKKRERGEKVFNQEYLCTPVYSEEAFVTPAKYDACVNQKLINYSFEEWKKIEHPDRDRVGGLDVGKKRHPSHFAVFEYNEKIKRWQQIHSKWLEGTDYTDQLDYCKEAIDTFELYELNYDSTRGEFEGFDERNEMPVEMTPVHFTSKARHSMATDLDKALTNRHVEFLPESRQRNQVLIVNNDLMAPETPEGHGDSFWSVCLALKDYEGADLEITLV